MRIRVRHEIRFRSDLPARNLVAVLRANPRSHEGQHVSDWWLDADIDCSLKGRDDEFGNLTHVFSAGGPINSMTIAATGTVDTFDTAGIVRATAERLPVEVFLRDTALTVSDEALRDFAFSCTSAETSDLGRLHALMGAVHQRLAFEAGGDVLPAIVAFEKRSGGRGSQAHVFVAGTRLLGIPCRVVGGYLVLAATGEAACHVWAEAFVAGLGWVGFDPVNNLCPQGEHIRCAVAFDAVGVASMRASHDAPMVQTLQVSVLN